MKKRLKQIIPVFLIRVIYNRIIKRKFDVKFGKKAGADLNTFFEGKNCINNFSKLSHSYVGFGTYIAGYTSFSKVKIGRYCSIGQRIKTNIGVHPTHLISTHPSFYSDKKQAGFSFVDKSLFIEHKYVDEAQKYLVQIGNDVWIGNDVTIMDGVKIGHGAIVGVGALVTNDVAPYSVVGGIPARIIKMRFSKEEIADLLKFQWWNREYTWIEKNHDLFLDKEKFFKEIQLNF